MVTPEGARSAIQALHGKEIGTHALTVSQLCSHQEPAGASSGGRGLRSGSISHAC
jgi:hypothetical protein